MFAIHGRSSWWRWVYVVLLATTVSGRVYANSAVIINSFGPNDSYSTASARIIGDNTASTSSSNNLEQAMQFTVPGAVAIRLESLSVAAHYDDGFPNQIDFHVRSDELGLPGAILETVSFSGVSSQAGGEVLFGNFLTQSLLAPGANYWLSATAPGGDNEGTMLWHMQLSNMPPRLLTSRNRSGPWTTPGSTIEGGVFRIIGVPVPEPASFCMTGAALPGLLWRRRAPLLIR
jgi:hypothetical protein